MVLFLFRVLANAVVSVSLLLLFYLGVYPPVERYILERKLDVLHQKIHDDMAKRDPGMLKDWYRAGALYLTSVHDMNYAKVSSYRQMFDGRNHALWNYYAVWLLYALFFLSLFLMVARVMFGYDIVRILYRAWMIGMFFVVVTIWCHVSYHYLVGLPRWLSATPLVPPVPEDEL